MSRSLESQDPPRAKVLVLGQLDGYANGIKPRHVTKFLEEMGHDVQLVDTHYLSRWSTDPGVRRALPAPSIAGVVLYVIERFASASARLDPFRRHLSGRLLMLEGGLRARLLRRLLPLEDVDLVICETPTDALVLLNCRATTLYDCPTPWADELWHEGRLTRKQHQQIRRDEANLFEAVDHLAFHWHSYASYAVDKYGITGENLLTLDFGCTPTEMRPTYDEQPRVVYLGSLSSRFIDLQLLSRLAAQGIPIDVYGGPPPDPALGLNYLGWATPSVLSRYQFGLITCTKDELRRRGFSAKHLEYFAYGLPVLVPAWREDASLANGSVAYTEETFQAVVQAANSPQEWQRLSDGARRLAAEYSWPRTLAPLERLVNGAMAEDGARSASQ